MLPNAVGADEYGDESKPTESLNAKDCDVYGDLRCPLAVPITSGCSSPLSPASLTESDRANDDGKLLVDCLGVLGPASGCSIGGGLLLRVLICGVDSVL